MSTFNPTALARQFPIGSTAHHQFGAVAGIVERVGHHMVWVRGADGCVKAHQGHVLVPEKR